MDNSHEPEIIYHYTGYESFYEIFRTKTILLSSIFNTNDELDGALSSIGHGEKPSEYFISFSSKFDSRLLWDAYGDRGRGVAIGFRLSALQDILNSEESHWRQFLREQLYSPGEDFADFGQLGKVHYQDNQREGAKTLALQKTLFWSEEVEWRLRISQLFLEPNLIVPRSESRFTNKKIKSVIPVSILKSTSSFTQVIPEIILGPYFDPKNFKDLSNFISMDCGIAHEHFKFLHPNEGKPNMSESSKLKIFVSRGNPESIRMLKG